jgi:hypothetical protein
MTAMTRDDIVRFAARDWDAVARSKTAAWIEQKARLSPAEVLRLGDELRRHAAAVRPDWPTDADRNADRAAHERVTEALRAVASFTTR